MSNSTSLVAPAKRIRCHVCNGSGQVVRDSYLLICDHCDGMGCVRYIEPEVSETLFLSPKAGIAAPIEQRRADFFRTFMREAEEQRKAALTIFPDKASGYVTWYYIATSGAELVEEGLSLENFVHTLITDWSDLGEENIAVWRMDGDASPRLVAYLYSGPKGETLVKWL